MRLRLVRARAAARARASPWSPRSRRSPSWGGSRSPRSPTSSPPPTSSSSPASRSERSPASRSEPSPRSSPTSSSRRARGRSGRWRDGAPWASRARSWRASCAAASPAAGCSRRSADWPGWRSAPGWTCINGRSRHGRTSIHMWLWQAPRFPTTSRTRSGNVVFCLLIGPAFLRALARYRRRLEVRWERTPAPVALGVVAVALLLLVPAAAGAATPAQKATALPRQGAEQGRRLRRERRQRLEPALHRLGGARPAARRAGTRRT